MSSACPFCNAELPSIAAPPTLPRTPCPRCGEPVPSERFPVHGSAVAAGQPPADATPTPTPRNPTRTLRVVVSIMVGMAVFALIFALFTQRQRRANDFKNRPADTVLLTDKPAQLLALRYLPKGTNVLAGVHVAALGKSKAGQALLASARPELLSSMLSTLEKLGLALEDVNHVVLAYEIKDVLPLATIVIVTTRPYGAARLKHALATHGASESAFRGTPLFKLTKLPQVPKLWCAAPRVLVWTTLKTDDLERITPSKQQAMPLDALTPAARSALTDRVGKQSPLWAVGDLEPARELIDLAQLLGLLPKQQARLFGLVRSFALSITTDDNAALTLVGEFHTGRPAATQELQKYLEAMQIKGANSQKTTAPPANIADPASQWVTWQVRGDADTMHAAIGMVWLTMRRQK